MPAQFGWALFIFALLCNLSEGAVVPMSRPFAITALRSQLLSSRYTGKGVTVGVMSLSYNSLLKENSDIQNGLLPGPGNPNNKKQAVVVLSDMPIGTHAKDEGRAMLQVVHGIAPDAKLCFIMPTSIADAIVQLADKNGPCGADIIADDVKLGYGPPFEDGPADQEVDRFVAHGGIFFSAANNQGAKAVLFPVRLVSRDSPRVHPALKAMRRYRFWTVFPDESVFRQYITKGRGDSIAQFYWNEPTGSVWTDFDLYIFDQSTMRMIASGTRNNINRGLAFERVSFNMRGPGVILIALGFVNRLPPKIPLPIPTIMGWLHVTASLKLENGTIAGHTGARSGFAVGAYDYRDTSKPTSMSSHGPVIRYWSINEVVGAVNGTVNHNIGGLEEIDIDGQGMFTQDISYRSEASLLSSVQGEVRFKPEFGSVHCLPTSVPLFTMFCGTSCAAPSAAGLAALLKEMRPLLTRDILLMLVRRPGRRGVGAVRPTWHSQAGFGLLNGDQLMKDLTFINFSTISSGSLPQSTPTHTQGTYIALSVLVSLAVACVILVVLAFGIRALASRGRNETVVTRIHIYPTPLSPVSRSTLPSV
mmetsp:Transcript_36420/g.58908  ORF Transcript_36420/g.58908 Transcript_36420/m.58908 type:complete len:588 (+) Transcript_36420:241-2004(+)